MSSLFRRQVQPDDAQVEAARAAAIPLDGGDGEFDELLRRIGNARFVLLGEASHGTHEFYEARARITRRLIAERGFDAVAIEGDWPDAYRVNRHVRGLGDDRDASGALAGFQRFPTWMWRNTAVVDFVDRLRAWNDGRPAAARAGFYGLDLYSLNASMSSVLEYLDREDPAVAARARERYACFEPFGGDSQVYGLMTGLGSTPSCEEGVIRTLVDLQHRRARGLPVAGDDPEAQFDAEQNAALVRDAERYYRGMYLSDVSSWNERDTHMARTLWEIDRHLSRPGRPARIVVWAHNSHLGDASHTEMGQARGELNLGQLVRERFPQDCWLVGFTTHDGAVTAATEWDAKAEHKRVNPSRGDSIEGVLHATGLHRFLLPFRDDPRLSRQFEHPLLERAIGVIYRPDTERQSHYFHAQVARQFDALIHVDRTRAVEPLEADEPWAAGRAAHAGEAPETFPQGL
ncbi:MAG TPA: erythromycin esterase family protein [Burkholderiaceae bacterium]